MKHLDFLLTSSEPGSDIHHLHVLAGPLNAFGLPDTDKLEFSVYAIAPTGSVDPEQFLAQTLVAAGVNEVQKGRAIAFAGLSKEAWAVLHDGNDGLYDKLKAQGKLEEHPNACEITMLYAACRDGRRWRGRRWLTGPQAGKSEDVTVLVGEPTPGEDGGIRAGRLVRALVGIRS